MILALIGFFVAALGTLIGVGGGFVFVPILLFLYPEQASVWVAGMSMWLVAMNASSGSAAYYLRGKVHLRSAAVFILAALPGSVLGVWIERFVSRELFELIFGVCMLAYSTFLFFKKKKEGKESEIGAKSRLATELYIKGAVISFFVGFVAAFLGIGGGVIHVPLLAHMLGFPVHMATGTSHFILAVTAIFTTATHVWHGDIDLRDPQLWMLGAAAIAGAQLGAHLNKKVSGPLILRLLSVALFFVGLRLVYGGARHFL
jgi:uncharacterized membrane protein YfcA